MSEHSLAASHVPHANAQPSTLNPLLHFESLARRSLTAWGLPNDCQLSLLKHRENAVFKVVTPQGTPFALRIHRSGYHSDAALRSELQWMAALSDAGLRTPVSIPTASGDDFASLENPSSLEICQIDLLSWIDGKPLGSVEDGLSGDVSRLAATYRQVGAMAGRLHRLSAEWPKPADFTRHAWNIDGCFSEQAIWGSFRDLDLLSSEERQKLITASDRLVRFLENLGDDPQVYGLIHCDFVPENLMAAEDGIYLIDFDDAGYGWYLFEIATSLFFFLGEPYFDDVFHALIEGYRTERSLSDDHLALLPGFFLMRSLVYLGWAHSRRETETAKEMTPQIVEASLQLAEAFLTDH